MKKGIFLLVLSILLTGCQSFKETYVCDLGDLSYSFSVNDELTKAQFTVSGVEHKVNTNPLEDPEGFWFDDFLGIYVYNRYEKTEEGNFKAVDKMLGTSYPCNKASE